MDYDYRGIPELGPPSMNVPEKDTLYVYEQLAKYAVVGRYTGVCGFILPYGLNAEIITDWLRYRYIEGTVGFPQFCSYPVMHAPGVIYNQHTAAGFYADVAHDNSKGFIEGDYGRERLAFVAYLMRSIEAGRRITKERT